MLELQNKVNEYYEVMDELIERVMKDDIEKDDEDWNELDKIKDEVKRLALLI